MRQIIYGMLILSGMSGVAAAQEMRNEITVQGSGSFTRKSTDAGVTYKPTSSGGFSAGYRLNITSWLGIEGDYDQFRNSQKFVTSDNVSTLQAKVQAATGSVVVMIPNPFTKRLHSYLMAGGGVLLFSPRDTDIVESRTKGTIVLGGGFDISVTKHLLFRAQCKGFMNKAPDFAAWNVRTDKFTQTIVPSAGLVFTF